MKIVTGREAVLAAAGDTPYPRLYTGGDGEITGYLGDGVLAWTGPWAGGAALGDGERAAALFGQLRTTGWVHLPRVPRDVVSRHLTFTECDDWEYLWTATPPPALPGEERVVPLADDDAPAVNALLDEALPGSTTRPGDARARRWYGIREADRLIACGVDRSNGGVGYLAGLAVAGDRRGRGLGAALTAALTRRLLSGYPFVSLAVYADNTPAVRLYRRLGFTATLSRTSVRLA